MKNRVTKIGLITTFMCLLPMGFAALVYDRLPARMPIHFDAAGNADNFASKAFACFAIPAFLAGMNVLLHFLIQADPKRKNANGVVKEIARWSMPVLSIGANSAVILKSLGHDVPMEVILPLVLGVLFIVLGNYMPKCKQNYTIGFKLPWTLNNEDNWNKTHRLAGAMMMLGGVLILISAFVKSLAVILFVIAILLMVLIPGIYSYLLHKRGL